MFFCRSFVRLLLFQLQPRGLFSDFFFFPNSFQATRHIGGVATLSHLRLFRNSHQLGHHLVSFFQICFSFSHVCVCACVYRVWNVFSYYRMCSLTTESVLLHSLCVSCVRLRVCVLVCVCVRACVRRCLHGGVSMCV